MRDLGGLPTRDGGRVTPGRLIRSDNLQDLSEADVRRLVDELGVTDVVDLRSETELHLSGPGPLHEVESLTHHHHSLLAAKQPEKLREPVVRRRLAELALDLHEHRALALRNAWIIAKGGTPIAEGTRWRIPELAATLRRIAEHGPAGFYEGETADLIVAEMQRGGGIITHEDLRRYEAKWRDPVVFLYRGHTVISMPPPSSGGLTLALIANILEGYDLRALGWHSPDMMQLAALVGTGILGGLAHILLTESYRHAPASLVAPFGYATMLWAFVFGWLFFREIPVPLVFAGAAIVAGAGLYVFFRERQLGLRRPHEVEGQGGAG